MGQSRKAPGDQSLQQRMGSQPNVCSVCRSVPGHRQPTLTSFSLLHSALAHNLLLTLAAKLCPPTFQPGMSMAPLPAPFTPWQPCLSLCQAMPLPYLLNEKGDGRGGGCAWVTAFTPLVP